MRIIDIIVIAVVLFVFYALDPGTFMQIWGLLTSAVTQGLTDLVQYLQSI